MHFLFISVDWNSNKGGKTLNQIPFDLSDSTQINPLQCLSLPWNFFLPYSNILFSHTVTTGFQINAWDGKSKFASFSFIFSLRNTSSTLIST